jgi:hypothetical protein
LKEKNRQGSRLNDTGDAASSELEARSEEFVERLNGPLYRIKNRSYEDPTSVKNIDSDYFNEA